MNYPDPALVLRKSGPAAMNLGQWGNFGIDVQNTGGTDAWNVSIRDLLPLSATGGMCNLTPQILSAQVFAADGVTPVAGKGPLSQGKDYSLSYSSAPNCQLNLTMLTAAGTISPNQRLIIHYQTQLDANTQNSVTLTNIAGAIQWFNGDSSVAGRKTFTGPLTNGTPGVLDNQDAFTVTVGAPPGYEFDKTVADLTSGANPATTAAPGDKLRYTLRFRTTNQALNNFSIVDDMDALNPQADFAPGTLTLVASPAGADVSATSSTGGTKGTGLINVRNLSLPVNSQAVIQFDITLKPAIANGTVVTNQATLRLANGTTFAWSDDPNVNGIADPTVPNGEDPTRLTIVSPVVSDPALVLTKSGPATMNLGQWGTFGLDVQNTGQSDAWSVVLRDLLPNGATGGMCAVAPTILSAQVFAADGVTPVSGKGPLNQGSDYSMSYSAAPDCQLILTMLTEAATISANQHLIIRYQTQLDANTQNGATLTNVAGAILWFNAASNVAGRKTFTGPLTNGTPGVLDTQDAHTVTVALTGYEFDKTVADLTSGANPATTAAPGDKLRYTLRFRTTNQALNNFNIVDDMDSLNAQAAFVPGTLTLVTFPAADISATSATGGTKGTGVIDIRNLSLPANGTALIQFDITLKAPIANGTVVTNQATLRLANGTTFAWSDDPNVNGIADPTVPNNEDPTRVTIASVSASDPALVLTKSGPATMNLGQWGTFGLDIQNTGQSDAWNVSLRDLLPQGATGGMCNLTPTILNAQVFAADGVTPIAGKGALNQGTDYSFSYSAAPNCQLNLTMLTAAGTISANQHLIIRYQTQLDANSQSGATLTNVAGATQWFNGDSSVAGRKTYTGLLTNGTPGVLDNQDAHTVTVALAASDPALVLTKSGPATMNLGQLGAFGLDIQNTGQSDAWNVSLRDLLPSGATGGMCAVMPTILSAQVFAADGVTQVSGKGALNQGTDYSFSYSAAPNCQLNLTMLTAAGTISANQHLIIRYQTQLDANTQSGATLTNVAGAIQWFNGDSSVAGRKTYTGPLTNGTPGLLDNQDAHTVTAALASYEFDKTVADLTSGANPATTAAPGDKLRYTLRFRTTSQAVNNFSIVDDMDALNAQAVFVPGTLTLVASPAGADLSATNATGGTKGTGVIDIRNLSLPANSTALIQFDITLKSPIANGTVVANQATLRLATGTTFAWSDDPNVNGIADPTVPNGEDLTRVTIVVAPASDPALVLTKSGPATMNLGQWGTFGIDIQNTGQSDAWNVFLRDLLPQGATGGMCSLTPGILSAQVFAADGVTPVPGKGLLNQGTDYSFSYSAAPNCQLDITMLTAAGRIGQNEHLIFRYRTQLDANTQNGVTLTNIAGAIQWFNGDSSVAGRKAYTGSLSNGTPGVLDNQDAFTVTTALSGYEFDKTVADLTSGANPAATAAPGDKLRYTLRFRTTGQALNNFSIFDDMDALNAQADFASGTLTLVTSPAGADISNTSSTGGTKGTGVIDIRNLSLAANSVAQIQFDITLKSPITNGTVVANQATVRLANGTTFAWSDDPNVNGVASDPTVPNGEDPTRVTIASAPTFRVQKISTDLTGDPNVLLPGDTLRYTIAVKNISNADAVNVMLRDAVPANTTYVAGSTTLNGAKVADVAGVSPLVNGMPINSPANLTPGSMPADASSSQANVATITFDVVVNPNTPSGTLISNQGFVNTTGVVNQPSDDPRTPAPNDPTVNIVGGLADPALVLRKSGPATLNIGQWGNFALDVQNTGASDAWNVSLRDLLPHIATGSMCNLTPQILSAQVFATDGVTAVAGKGALTQGTDYSLNYSAAPNCQLDITILTAAGTIGPNQRLIIHYQTQLDANTQNSVTLTNIAGAIQWFNGDSSVVGRKTYTGPLTNGTPGVLDNQDAFTVTTALSGYQFDKTVADLTSGANPATTAVPGDKLRYTLRFRTTSQALNNFSIFDDMDALNAQADFAAGTLTLVTSPAGADISNTSSTGGTKGTGVIDIRNLSLAANSVVQIQFDITLKPAIASGTVVTNQATLRLATGATFAWSDDPNVNGVAPDPTVPNGEDPTRVTIVSAAAFQVQKISTDLTGDPNVLAAGDTLRYTITVKNISSADAVNVMLRDAVPVNTAYVPGSTTLNGVKVADVAGVSPLVNGMPINSPANTTPGLMPADASSSPANVATITFDAAVNPNVPDGTNVCNQGFVSATGIANQPSDDPRTPALNDPACNIVVNRPVLYAEKHAVLFTDLSSPGIVDPGDVLRYTITIKNSAAIPATGVALKDAVPANTTYVTNSTLLNGSPVGQPDGGASPLASGINIGTISPGTSAVLQYDLRVNLGTPVGTQISNQAVVSSPGLPNLLTDSSGNPANAPQPTVVVVGAGQQLSITNQVSVVGGGPAIPGAQLDYVLNIVNSGVVTAYNVVITDDLNGSQPGQLAFVNAYAAMNGLTAGVSFAGSTITANYGAINGPLAPGGVVVVKFRATLNSSLALGSVVTNTGVVAWNNPTQTASASVSISVGSVPGTPGVPGVPAVLNGSAWYDANFDSVQDSRERALAGWTVELYRDNQLAQSVQTDTNGAYHINGIEPNDTTGVRYELRFRSPGDGPNTAKLGRAASQFTNGPQRISEIVVASGANLQGLNLPIHPNGVIYNSMARTPIAAATLTLLNAGNALPLPAGCFDDAAQQGQITLADGYYKFDINFNDPACPSGGDYLIGVTAPPGTNYAAGYSQIIPPASSASTAAFSVPACPGSSADVIPGTTQFCEVQPSEFAPAASVPPLSAGTTYYVHLRLDNSQIPGSSQIFNNHIPLDPQLIGSITVSKTTPLVNVTRGQLVPYTITANNHSGQLFSDVSIVDRLPAGLSYIKGSALLDGVPTEPSVAGLELSWNGLTIAGTQVRTVKLLLAVGAGATEGEFVNRAQVLLAASAGGTGQLLSRAKTLTSAKALNSVTGIAMSGEATATVRLMPDTTFDCTDVMGKVFNDANRNGRQDDGEEGIPGVRVVSARGLQATTDQYGRYHITCAITPSESRGSNFVLKLDDRTLPSGYRMSTDQVQIQRATSGKALQVNFGAEIHRVVSIDLLDEAFEPGKTEIRVQWKPRLNLLIEQLRKEPAVLRLSYVADTEDAALVKQRVEAFKRQLSEAWGEADSSYVLTIEPEVFWRRGAPPKQPEVRVPGNR